MMKRSRSASCNAEEGGGSQGSSPCSLSDTAEPPNQEDHPDAPGGGMATGQALRPRSQRRAAAASRSFVAASAATTSAAPPASRPAPGDDSDGDDEAEGTADGAEKKLRFVWTSDMHARFEASVHQLGVTHAKPQAIRQLMGCEGEEMAPTRQNIKSHLQKYRLLLHKQAGGRPASPADPASQQQHPPPPPPPQQQQQQHAQGTSSALLRAPLPQPPLRELDRQNQFALFQQLELHAKLHERLILQQRVQIELSLKLATSSHKALETSQLMRLAQHVMLQRQLLQHLCAMLQAHTDDVMRGSSQLAATLASERGADANRQGGSGGAMGGSGGVGGIGAGGGGAGGGESSYAALPLCDHPFGTGGQPGALHGGLQSQFGLLPPPLGLGASHLSPDADLLQVDEVPSQAEVMSGFGEMSADIG